MAGTGWRTAEARIPPHNWENYDFGPRPAITDRLNQGPLNAGGSLDPGYPLPGKVRQVEIPLPKGTDWRGLKLFAELEVKNIRYPVKWACRQMLNEDGSLSLRSNI